MLVPGSAGFNTFVTAMAIAYGLMLSAVVIRHRLVERHVD